MTKVEPRLVTYAGAAVIVIDGDDLPNPAGPLFDRRPDVARDAILDPPRRRPLTAALLLAATAIAPAHYRSGPIDADEGDMYGIQRTQKLLEERRIAAARAAEAPPVVRPPGESDQARAQQRDRRRRRRAAAELARRQPHQRVRQAPHQGRGPARAPCTRGCPRSAGRSWRRSRRPPSPGRGAPRAPAGARARDGPCRKIAVLRQVKCMKGQQMSDASNHDPDHRNRNQAAEVPSGAPATPAGSAPPPVAPPWPGAAAAYLAGAAAPPPARREPCHLCAGSLIVDHGDGGCGACPACDGGPPLEEAGDPPARPAAAAAAPLPGVPANRRLAVDRPPPAFQFGEQDFAELELPASRAADRPSLDAAPVPPLAHDAAADQALTILQAGKGEGLVAAALRQMAELEANRKLRCAAEEAVQAARTEMRQICPRARESLKAADGESVDAAAQRQMALLERRREALVAAEEAAQAARTELANRRRDWHEARARMVEILATIIPGITMRADTESLRDIGHAVVCLARRLARGAHGVAGGRGDVEARQPATVGGLLATAPLGSVIEYRDADESAWHQVEFNATMTAHRLRYGSWGSWKQRDMPMRELRLPARLVPASEADADPATRGPLPKGG